MPGPLPNPNARRRNRGSGWVSVVLPAGGRDEPPPQPPATYVRDGDRRKLLKATREAWGSWWRSPMATAWLPADEPALRRAIVLVDVSLRGEASGVELKELRALEEAFGLSPKARRALRWAVQDSGNGGDEAASSSTVVPLTVVPDEDEDEAAS